MHELQASWQSQLAEMGCGAATTSLDGRIHETNALIVRWLGPCAGRRLTDVMTRGSAIYWETAASPMLESKGQVHDVAIDLEGKEGTLPVVIFGARRGDANEFVLVPFHVRARYEETLATAEARLASQQAALDHLTTMERMRTDFINSVAHELSTPMTPLTLQANLLQRLAAEREDAKLAKAAKTMVDNLERLQHFHRSLVTAAELQASNVGIDLEPISLDVFVRDTLARWKPRHGAHRPIESDLAPVTVQADRSALESCLEHLLDNAVRFSQSEDLISIATSPDGTLVVQDSGRGIDKERLLGLGRAFAKGDDASTMLGAGLGLYIVKGLMQAQGGRFAIASEGLGHGTRVTLSFQTAALGPGAAAST